MRTEQGAKPRRPGANQDEAEKAVPSGRAALGEPLRRRCPATGGATAGAREAPEGMRAGGGHRSPALPKLLGKPGKPKFATAR